jgi:hypothetical protein
VLVALGLRKWCTAELERYHRVPVVDSLPIDAGTTGDEQHLNLFNTRAYNARNLVPGAAYLRIDHQDGDGRLVGSLCGVVEGTTFGSGWKAPFAGPDFMRKAETVSNVGALVDHVLAELKARGIRTVRIKCKPTFYSGSEVYVVQALMHRGFRVESSELSYHFDLEHLHDGEAYRAALGSAARRALKHAAGKPFSYEEVLDDATIATAYEVIRANRERKQRPLRLSLEYLRGLSATFPGRIRWFLLRYDGTPVASALLYRLRPERELVEYWGDQHNLERSPMNLLAFHVVERAIRERVTTVDLGLSSVNGVPDPGLIQFKQSVGCRPELRLDFVREL